MALTVKLYTLQLCNLEVAPSLYPNCVCVCVCVCHLESVLLYQILSWAEKRVREKRPLEHGHFRGPQGV